MNKLAAQQKKVHTNTDKYSRKKAEARGKKLQGQDF